MFKVSGDQGVQAFRILQFTFVIAPILAGFDKFFNVLTDWSNYISPFVSKIVSHHDHGFMMVAGVIEIVAGIGVIYKPRVFAYIVAVWLLGIVINLLLTGQYFDIALRDLGLALAALALGKLSEKYSQ